MINVSLYFILAHALSKQNSYSVTFIDNKHVSLNSGFDILYITTILCDSIYADEYDIKRFGNGQSLNIKEHDYCLENISTRFLFISNTQTCPL